MGNWTDRFDPETVDEIKRYEVGEGDFLLAERLAMHKGVESMWLSCSLGCWYSGLLYL
mgnify:CR=1 FL=1